MSKPTIAVWFSCGAASAVAAKITVEKYADDCDIRIVNNPVANEDEDNQRFRRDVEAWVGQKFENAINPKYPSCDINDVFADRQYVSGIAGAPCTLELKKEARQHWEAVNLFNFNPDNLLVLGFTADKNEVRRHERFKLQERDNILPVLINEGITKGDCFRIISEAGLKLPRIYDMGYPNANCIGCVKSASPTYWNHVRKMHPEVFQDRAEVSRKYGARLVKYKGERLFLDELPEDAQCAPMKDMNVECGIFCDMKEL
jgi:hypothetical protein